MGTHGIHLRFRCPACEQPNRVRLPHGAAQLKCAHCGWSRSVRDAEGGDLRACFVCGCRDLWRQKDFPQRLGLLMVVTAALLSTVAVAYHWPKTALGILMAFALIDFALYALMGDVLVCYRCGARHVPAAIDDDHPRFNLETHERYRQEAQRIGRATQVKLEATSSERSPTVGDNKHTNNHSR